MAYDLQFVDQISSTPTVRLNLNARPWKMRVGTEFGMPELRRAAVQTLLVDGDRYPAAAYGNRTLSLLLRVDGASDDDDAAQLQKLYRELDRPTNTLLYRPGTTAPVFFRTFRCGPDAVTWDPFTKEVRVQVPAEPFALGLRETLPAVTVYNDPAEGTTLNSNPNFETNAAGWSTVGAASFVRSTAQFHEGVASGLLTPNGVAANTELYSESVAVSVGQQVRASAWVRCAVARNVQIFTVWFDSGGGFLSSGSTTTAVSATTWTLLDRTGTAPVGAAFARLGVVMDGTPPAGHTLHIDEARIRQAGGAGGMCFDVTSPKGDVEAPLFLSVRASDVARVPESPLTGRRQSAFAVRRGGTPSAAPVVLQAESMDAGTDTTVQAASGSSGPFLRVTFATATSLQQRASIAPFPSSPSTDARGTYRVFVRCRKSVAGDTMQLQMRYSNAAASVTSDLVAGPADAVWRWVDMGLVQMPLGYDPATDGLSGTPLPVGGMGVTLLAARTSGSGTLDLDVIVFLPADDRMCLVKWPDYNTETAYVVDPVAGQAYGVGSSGEVRSALLELIGLAPQVTPGVANRIWMIRDVGSTWSEGDDVTASVQVTPYYWPRYLHTRGAS
ncbi:hypothetical protein [Micromonospora sp. DPT]|uniref:hypothetical protein n=1 Tax=Micromonospora sp. DPT TaxID=3142975 RepID=UPI003208F72B